MARALEQAVRQAWSAGWQPADVVRVVQRGLGARHRSLAVDVIAADAERYRHTDAAAAADWLCQLDAIGARPWWSAHAPHLTQWAARNRLDLAAAARTAEGLVALLRLLPPIQRLCVPPDEWPRAGSAGPRSRSQGSGGGGAATVGLDTKVLDRVRALLAKAESTTFPEEADALTAKAQQLMARHAIDQAMLAQGDGHGSPVGRRLGIDDPYASAKFSLLAEVSAAGRCRTVWSRRLGFATVFGFPHEIEAVELLYTSLLVQATAAMLAAGARPEHRRARTRGFRQSFLVAFGIRIGQRLREAAQATVTEAEHTHGSALLPVLASRSQAVDDACEQMFPGLRAMSVSATDGAGWAAGATAAELASLATGPALGSAQE